MGCVTSLGHDPKEFYDNLLEVYFQLCFLCYNQLALVMHTTVANMLDYLLRPACPFLFRVVTLHTCVLDTISSGYCKLEIAFARL